MIVSDPLTKRLMTKTMKKLIGATKINDKMDLCIYSVNSWMDWL